MDNKDFLTIDGLISKLKLLCEASYSKSFSHKITFILGSALSHQRLENERQESERQESEKKYIGVPSVPLIIEKIIKDYPNSKISDSSNNPYQDLFDLLFNNPLGEEDANRVIMEAVLEAYLFCLDEHYQREIFNNHSAALDLLSGLCSYLLEEERIKNWELTDGVKSLGELISAFPRIFGRNIITTNFDPLIEVSTQIAHGSVISIAYDNDGSLKYFLVILAR